MYGPEDPRDQDPPGTVGCETQVHLVCSWHILDTQYRLLESTVGSPQVGEPIRKL